MSLAERSARSELPKLEGVDVPKSEGPRRHCWVTGPADAAGPWPGLVVEWRQGPSGWLGRVVYVVDDPHPVLVEAWVAADQLRPARTRPAEFPNNL